MEETRSTGNVHFQRNQPGWMDSKVERYFLFYNLNDEEKLEVVVVGMDGDAHLWYQWDHCRRPIQRSSRR